MLGKLLGLFQRKPKAKPYVRQTPRTVTPARPAKPAPPIDYDDGDYYGNGSGNAARALAAMAGEIDATVIKISAVQSNEIRAFADFTPEVTRHHDSCHSSTDSHHGHSFSSDSSSSCSDSSSSTSSTDF